MRYDVVVAGASFAGLITATSLKGRVALVEKGEVGEGQTSACGTTLDLVQKLGLEQSIEEVHDQGVLHTGNHTVRFKLPYPFCTFDYRTFCRLLLDRFDGDLVSAAATGVEGSAVLTEEGLIEGRLLVDATGWRATLACSVAPTFPARVAVTYGLEKPCAGFEDRGLHFWFDPEVRGDGYAWSFPAGEVARAGLLSYVAPDGVSASTEAFLRREGINGDRTHGGFLTAGLRPATAGDVFLVGDSAGHCLPLTGEGIRPAAFFAQRLASIINDHLEGGRSAAEAGAQYRQLQAGYSRRYRVLRGLQRGLRGWPDPPLGRALQFLDGGAVYRYLARVYWEVAAPIEPAPALQPASMELKGASA
ncbi:MAG: NAD(P)/FAD-dependent oxidoreductase [Candidatus Dormibacteraeota bacterium]|nr:NAD(P)/FAD-dependent oxidoreductase [Candidatus Dormibacteraeota bacterium]